MFSAEITTRVINNFAAGTTHCEVIIVWVSAHSFEIGTGHMLLVLRGPGKLSTSSTSEKDPFSDLGDFKVWTYLIPLDF